MKVKDLIAILSNLPSDMPLYLCGADEFFVYIIDDYILIDHTELYDGDGDLDEAEFDELLYPKN